MKKKQPLKSIFLVIGIVAGMFIKGWFGGFAFGFFLALLIFYIVGKTAFEKSMKRLEKRIQDERITL